MWDWPRFLSVRERVDIRLWRLIHFTDGLLAHALKPHEAWRTRRNRIIRRAAAFFSQHESIITNRLHGTLLALICNRPVTIGDTGYGKLTAYYDSWLKDCNLVTKDTLTFRIPWSPELRSFEPKSKLVLS